MMNRRQFVGLAATTAFATVAGCSSTSGAAVVRLAAGEVGGLYYAFAKLLAEAADRDDDVRIEPVVTAGSRENMDLLVRGDVDAALTLADSVDEVAAAVCAIGRVYENYLQLVVRVDSVIEEVGDLRGARVNLGANGSGAAASGERILRTAGMDPNIDVAVSHRPLVEAVAALAAGDVDALLWAGGVPTGALDIPRSMRLVDLGNLTAPMRERYGAVYDRVAIPADAYPGGTAVDTIGVANLLLASPAMTDRAASAIVDLLLYHADVLVPAEAAGPQFLDGRSLIVTKDVPLHPGAADAYRRWHG